MGVRRPRPLQYYAMHSSEFAELTASLARVWLKEGVQQKDCVLKNMGSRLGRQIKGAVDLQSTVDSYPKY